MENYENLSIACPGCLEPIEANLKGCEQCKLVLTDQERVALSMAAEGIYYWSWEYGISFYEEYRATEQISSRYFLTPFEVLSYLASVIAAGVIGNLAYDLIKGIAFRALKRLRAKSEITFVIDPSKSDEQNFELLYKIAAAYIEYKKLLLLLKETFQKYSQLSSYLNQGSFLVQA